MHAAKIQDSGLGIGRNRHYYNFVNSKMIEHKPFIITIVGPESSGKTTLARQLAGHFGCPWVPEYAREYLEGLGRPYEVEDLDIMAERQLAAIWEGIGTQLAVGSGELAVDGIQLAVGNLQLAIDSLQEDWRENAFLTFYKEEFGGFKRPVLIVDSGMLSLRLWARIKYNKVIPFVEEALEKDMTSMYVLCRPLLSWEPDPLREAPSLVDRAWIYNHYLKELVAIQPK